MKKICFECPTLLLRRPIAEMIARLKEYEIGLVSPKDLIKGFLPIHYNKIKDAKIHDYTIINPPFSSYEWPIPVNPFFIIRLLKCLKKYDYIHVWVPFYITNTILAILKKIFFRNKKLFITIDTFPGMGLSFRMGKILDTFFKIHYNTLCNIIFSAANKIILYRESSKKYAISTGVPIEKIKVIPTGVNIKIKDKDKDIRKEFGIKNSEKIILFVGLINKRKGADLIVNIAKKLKNENVKFIIVGDGPQRKQYEKLVKSYGLTNKIIFTGFRMDVHNFYHEADIFILPSRGEGLPGVIMESMVYGVPVIGSNIAGIRDLIQNNKNGFLCKINDIDCYLEKIEILLKNEVLRKKFIEVSKNIIKNKYDWDKIIKKIKLIYR